MNNQGCINKKAKKAYAVVSPPPNNLVENLAKNIAEFLMPQVTQQVETVLQAHGLLKRQNDEGEPVEALDLHRNDNDEEEPVQPVTETSIPLKAKSLNECSDINLDDVSAEAAAKIAGRDLSSATGTLLVTDSTSVGTDNQFHDYIRLSDDVSDSLKTKIWSNAFENLADLLPSKNKSGYAMSCGIDSEGNPGIIWTQQGQNLKLTIDQWTSAFNIFMSVYLEKEVNEQEAPFLCKHADVVREIANLHGDWFMYDEQFRKNRARTGRSWANKHNELYCNVVAWDFNKL